MSKKFMLMEPKNENFNILIGSVNKYEVPRFQRDYAWDQEQWEDLWSDIENLDDDDFHYMGYIVLQQKEQYSFDVIDGQQRLVTLSLIIMAAMKSIQNMIDKGDDIDDNKIRLNELTNRFIGSKSVISLKVTNKLVLNRNNNRYFQRICSDLEAPNQRGTTATNKLIRKCFDFFCKKDFGNTGEDVAIFIEKVSSAMQFTKIIVQDDLNAYKVFETLNARGVQLSTPDLLKNYIFSIISNENNISDDDLTELDEQWSEIIEQLGEGNFTDFIRYHYNTKWKMVTKNELFSALKNVIRIPTEANEYLKSLFQYSSVYVSLINPEDSWWNDQSEEYIKAKDSINGIRLFNIKQPLTILLAAFDKFLPSEFVTISRYMYILSIRYNVICHLSPSEQESAYNVIATKISNGEFTRASHIKNSAEFKKLYPDDNMFKSAFGFHKMPSKQTAKKIRFILAEIENHNGVSCDYTKTTLEHICPYNPDQGWYEAFGNGINDIKDRLGNMVLISKDNLGRASFKEKKDEYVKSGFFLAKQVSSYDGWNLEKVNEHQKWMAGEAAKVWRVDFN